MTMSAFEVTNFEPHSRLISFFQPIVSVRRGTIVGFEALSRLPFGDMRSAPGDLLASLDIDARISLFCSTLKEGIKLCNGLGSQHAEVYVSVNVDASLLLHRAFSDVVRFILADNDFAPSRLVVEILEGEAIKDTATMAAAIRHLKAIGISIALDDVGSAYASLANIKDLPVDILKLDQAFSRLLGERPHDLQFVWSLLGLAHGLQKKLVVEGVETMDVYDALSILDVEYVQGFAISRPMDGAAVSDWIKGFQAPRQSRTPQTLLGAFAAHLMLVETCRSLSHQSLPILWKDECKNPHLCGVGRYLDKSGLHDSACGNAHKRFHHILPDFETDRATWEFAAIHFRETLADEIRSRHDRNRHARG